MRPAHVLGHQPVEERAPHLDLGGTVGELLTDLDARYPGFKQQIMQDGSLHRFVNIYLNDEDIRYLNQLDTRVKDGDSISILPALAGG